MEANKLATDKSPQLPLKSDVFCIINSRVTEILIKIVSRTHLSVYTSDTDLLSAQGDFSLHAWLFLIPTAVQIEDASVLCLSEKELKRFSGK